MTNWAKVMVTLAAVFTFILFTLMRMTVWTPNGSTRIRTDEVSAINSLRAITQAEVEYNSAYPASGFTCDLKALGGIPGSGIPSASAAQLLDNDLTTSGYKAGYLFKISNCEKVTENGIDRIIGYQLTAVPVMPGKTGRRGFCTDQHGELPRYDPAGGTNCTESLR